MRRLALTKKLYQGEDMLSSLLLNNVLSGNIISLFPCVKIIVDKQRILDSVVCEKYVKKEVVSVEEK